MADVEVDTNDLTNQDEDIGVGGDAEESNAVDEAIKWVDDEELDVNGPSTTEAEAMWLLKIPNDMYERLAPIKVEDEQKPVGTLRCWSDGTFEFIMPNEPEAGPSTTSKPAEEEKEVTYTMRDNPIPSKSAKWAFYEDERRCRWSGKSTERARPRLVKKVAKEYTLARKLTAAASTMALKKANMKEQQKKRKALMIDDVGLTQAQQNILAGGGLLETGIRRRADEKKNADKKPVKERAYRILPQHLQDILYEEFNRYKYWKMSTLQARLQQPASWIRKNLQAIAERETEGPYKDYWRLQDKFVNVQGEAENVGQAPEEQEYSDAAMLAVKNEYIDKGWDGKVEDEENAGGPSGQAGSSSAPPIDLTELGEMSDGEDDDDSEMDEVTA